MPHGKTPHSNFPHSLQTRPAPTTVLPLLALGGCVPCALYTVHCTLYTVHCALYTVHCTLYTTAVQYTGAHSARPARHLSTALHCSAVHCTAVHCSAVKCICLQCTAPHCTAVLLSVFHCTALHCPPLHSPSNTVQYTAQCTGALLQHIKQQQTGWARMNWREGALPVHTIPALPVPTSSPCVYQLSRCLPALPNTSDSLSPPPDSLLANLFIYQARESCLVPAGFLTAQSGKLTSWLLALPDTRDTALLGKLSNTYLQCEREDYIYLILPLSQAPGNGNTFPDQSFI